MLPKARKLLQKNSWLWAPLLWFLPFFSSPLLSCFSSNVFKTGIADEKVCLPCLEDCVMYGISQQGPFSSLFSLPPLFSHFPLCFPSLFLSLSFSRPFKSWGRIKECGDWWLSIMLDWWFNFCSLCHVGMWPCFSLWRLYFFLLFSLSSYFLTLTLPFPLPPPQCVLKRIANDGSPGPISFSGIECPICFQWIKHSTPPIMNRFKYFENLKKTVEELVCGRISLQCVYDADIM